MNGGTESEGNLQAEESVYNLVFFGLFAIFLGHSCGIWRLPG